ncbi:MAG: hypothetical protein SOR61_03625 [Evtepia sp.]|uniref:hypothetical protein n=1 Tax=Evtepia sp. TaxID=2773933 RepID=UPI002A74C989|nr:hypothetical protein [Evtepia sp.]MDY3014273.1 hypothetical protein [Evtepia sp.]
MPDLTTGDLTQVLLQTPFPQLPAIHAGSAGTPQSFAGYYLKKLEEKHCSRSQALAKSGLEVHYGYQILNGRKKPSRDKILCLCIGGGFSIRETNQALVWAEYSPLYPRRLRDAAIMLALNQKLPTLWAVNERLAELDLPLLG